MPSPTRSLKSAITCRRWPLTKYHSMSGWPSRGEETTSEPTPPPSIPMAARRKSQWIITNSIIAWTLAPDAPASSKRTSSSSESRSLAAPRYRPNCSDSRSTSQAGRACRAPTASTGRECSGLTGQTRTSCRMEQARCAPRTSSSPAKKWLNSLEVTVAGKSVPARIRTSVVRSKSPES